MPIILTENSKPGDLYIDENNRVFIMRTYCTEPTVTVEDVLSGNRVSDAIGTTRLAKLKPLDKLQKKDLLAMIKLQAENLSAAGELKNNLVQQIVNLRNELALHRSRILQLMDKTNG